ncbi:unnamed protein product, partial [marine sediment metagenome]
MVNKRYIFIVLLILLIIVPYSLGAGICELDKEIYSAGETATFTCVCSLPNEENQAGYIVFIQDNGTILKSTLTNSNSCRSSLFGGSHTFLTGDNFTGEARFSSNSDGTGIPPNWDITTDNFNVTGSHIGDCVIEFEIPINVTPVFDLGRQASLSIEVEDG